MTKLWKAIHIFPVAGSRRCGSSQGRGRSVISGVRSGCRIEGSTKGLSNSSTRVISTSPTRQVRTVARSRPLTIPMARLVGIEIMNFEQQAAGLRFEGAVPDAGRAAGVGVGREALQNGAALVDRE